MTAGSIAPAFALAALEPGFFDSLSDAERLVLPFMYDLWLRPEQRIPRYGWRDYGFISGRGWGKSLAIAAEINRRVEAGESRHLALMAPNSDRVDEVQIQFLIDTAPPWFRPERYLDSVIWPNGVTAECFTPEAPGRSRSGNFDLTWLCEIVDWVPSTRKEAFDNITTATRVGAAQVIWDTTSKGKNDVIQALEKQNREDPYMHPIQRGAMYDNPLLSPVYLRTETKKYVGRRAREEIWGETFSEAAGAAFQQSWLDDHRRLERPTDFDLRLCSLDPALSTRIDADETGLIVGDRDRAGHCYVAHDLSGRHAPETWGDLVIGQCADHGAAGVVIERNHAGDPAAYVITSRAATRGLVTRYLAKDKPFPRRTPGVVYIREVTAASSKSSRASGPATIAESGRLHLVGHFSELEQELTTYEPGTAKSPNRYDAAVYLVIELAGLALEAPRNGGARGDVSGAALAHAKLREALRAAPRRAL